VHDKDSWNRVSTSDNARGPVYLAFPAERMRGGVLALLADAGIRAVLGRRGAAALPVVIASLVGAGCGDVVMAPGGPSADPRSASGDPRAGTASEVCVAGRATGEGVECQAFRTDDGRLYTLIGDLGSLAGDHDVCVCGRPVEMSTCMQGTTIRVTRIDPPATCP
jgi:hypothetical protein